MKNTITKIIAMWLFIFICASGYAQKQSNATNQKSPSASVQLSSKDELVQKLNDFQPQLNDLLIKSKRAGPANSDLTKEVNQLNKLINEFRVNLDKFDTTPADQQNDFITSLNNDWGAIQVQYTKATDIARKSPN